MVTGANQEWALDFVRDAAEIGRKFRVLGGGAEDRVGAYSAGTAGAERARGKFPREVAG
jgi:hypothetical protein